MARPEREQILGVILAGGLARRMGGGDKGRLRLGPRSLIEHVRLRTAPQVGRLVLNANGDPARFADLGLPVVADGVPGYPGPLAGILAGMDRAAGAGFSHVLTVAADTPFPPETLAADLAAALDPAPIAIAVSGGRRQPVFGLWPVALREDLRRALVAGVSKVMQWAGPQGVAEAAFPEGSFLNVNTPDDLEQARRQVEG
ncbi:molybdenum cofactor guanylyltransferase MobA [Paenirhodobacter sp.]|uniref:molybdenum cofactor guanylyltransferase MobA n=1 Tax=Paenirhodobacter sp. TaxID=1965326 RepID=UPI003B416F46